ncbi:MAG: hypothetical protein NZ480_03790 [Bdellovibrionaceae bacterium]|nr:hypothetical protein [Pseudobdellovibrionaceae bacterium]MDW8190033.1 hypothetical protein [Pseudobdellovibrionaceae bacterium]
MVHGGVRVTICPIIVQVPMFQAIWARYNAHKKEIGHYHANSTYGGLSPNHPRAFLIRG